MLTACEPRSESRACFQSMVAAAGERNLLLEVHDFREPVLKAGGAARFGPPGSGQSANAWPNAASRLLLWKICSGSSQ